MLSGLLLLGLGCVTQGLEGWAHLWSLLLSSGDLGRPCSQNRRLLLHAWGRGLGHLLGGSCHGLDVVSGLVVNIKELSSRGASRSALSSLSKIST